MRCQTKQGNRLACAGHKSPARGGRSRGAKKTRRAGDGAFNDLRIHRETGDRVAKEGAAAAASCVSGRGRSGFAVPLASRQALPMQQGTIRISITGATFQVMAAALLFGVSVFERDLGAVGTAPYANSSSSVVAISIAASIVGAVTEDSRAGESIT
jgi:hypothetical protein